MPIVDSVSGYFHDKYPIGQVYRVFYFAYMLFLLMYTSGKTALSFICPFLIFLTVQVIVSLPGGYVLKSIQDTIKLFTPFKLYMTDSSVSSA